MGKRIGIDLGGTKTEIVLTQDDPLDVIIRKRIPTNADKGYDYIVNQLSTLVQEVMQDEKDEVSIGLGIPGSLSPKTGLVRNANTTCLNGKPLKVDLENSLKREVIIENDANCFALSEAVLGAGKGHRLVLGIIMGTGIGGGIIWQGKLVNGIHGITGEWGHSSINFEGPECWCGQRGCVERYLSGPAIEQAYSQMGGTSISVNEIYEASLSMSDPLAKNVMSNVCFYFGRFLSNLLNTVDPDIIILGGGVSNLPLLYKEGLVQVEKQMFHPTLDIPIVQNQLGDSSGVFGAAMLA